MTRLRAMSVLALVVAPLALTGCEKPDPGVSVFSGGTTVRESALCWQEETDEALDPEACVAGAEANTGSISVVPGDTIGIDVDPELIEHGWYPTIGDSRLTAEPLEGTYFRFALGEGDFQEGPLDLRILALDEDGEGRGIWAFQVERA